MDEYLEKKGRKKEWKLYYNVYYTFMREIK